MSTNTFSFTSSHPNLFGTLLYKEWRQVRSGVLWLVAIFLLIDTLLMILKSLALSSADYSYLFYVANGAAPVLAMLVASLTLAQELQTGTWTWSTSLPASPWQTFSSKFLVWLAVSFSTVVLLNLFAAVACWFEVSNQQFDLVAQQNFEQAIFGFALGIQLYFAICIFVFFFEPLVGLCIAAALVGILQLLIQPISEYVGWQYSSIERDGNFLSIATLLFLHFLLSVIFGVCSYRIYRWRWGAGHFWEWARRERRPELLLDSVDSWSTVSLRKPTPLKAMLWLDWAGGAKPWLILGTSIIALTAITRVAMTKGYVEFAGWYAPLCFVGFVAFGINSFGKDRWRSRGLFLADKGLYQRAVAAKTTYCAFFLSIFGLATTVSFCFEFFSSQSFRGSYIDWKWNFWAMIDYHVTFLIYSLGLFQLSLMSGATFRNPVIAVLMATISFWLVGFSVQLTFDQINHYVLENGNDLGQPNLAEMLPGFACLAAIFVFVRLPFKQFVTRGKVPIWPFLIALLMIFLGLLLPTVIRFCRYLLVFYSSNPIV
jgi:hypothetical protein